MGPCSEDAQRWQRCLDVMHLVGEQQEHLLLLRRSHLSRMRGIYQERHNLNMQAMQLMLPHTSANPAEDNTVEGRLSSMSISGYLDVARSSALLGEVLDKIKVRVCACVGVCACVRSGGWDGGYLAPGQACRRAPPVMHSCKPMR